MCITIRCVKYVICICVQAKCGDLDSRLLALSKDKKALKQKIDALQLNADKLNPNKKVVAKETVRYLVIHFEGIGFTLFVSQSCSCWFGGIRGSGCCAVCLLCGD